MIIFGWRGRSSIEQTGIFDCPVCKAKTQFVVSRSRPWFTLFFVPIFPVGSGIRAKICAGCGTILDPDRNDQPPVVAPTPLAAMSPNSMQSGNPAFAQSRFSTLAIISLIAGFVSPIFIIACFLSVITSTVAIVTGHIALYKIKRSKNRLDGRAVAIVGVVLGYLSMALTIAFMAFIYSNRDTNSGGETFATTRSSSQSRLDDAELSVVSGSKESIGRGNTQIASSLATNFAAEMKRVDAMVFKSNGKPGFQLSGGEYRTYCELHENSCAFIVHVPSYRNFSKDAEEALKSIAWLTAMKTVKDHLKKGDSLAVGLRGAISYGDILVGTYSGDPNKQDYRVGSAKDLVPFFDSEGKRRLDIGKPDSDSLATLFPAEVPDKSAEPSPFDTPTVTAEPEVTTPIESPFSEKNSSASVQPVEKPKESAPIEPSSKPSAPTVEPRKTRSPPKPKREAPAFQNKIPVTLLKSIDSKGWNIQSMIFDQKGNRVITGGLDETISVFDTQTGEMLFRSKRQEELGQVISLTLSKDGKTIFAGGSKGRVASYEIKDDGQVNVARSLYKHSRDAECLVVSPKFPFVLSGGEDGTVAWQPYDERSSSVKLVQELKRKVLAAHLFSDRNEGMATDGQTLIRFSVKDSKVLDQAKLGSSYPHAAAFSPDGSRCAVSYGSELKQFETATGNQIGELAGTGMVWSVMFHPTQKWLITGVASKATIWDIESSECLAMLDAGSIQNVKNMAITADGHKLAFIPSSAGQSIQVFDLTK